MDALFALVPVCEYHHEVDQYQDCGDMDKDFHRWVAINRMTPDDEKEYPRTNWAQLRTWLNSKYGTYERT
jgi:hypothetical protein